MDEQRNRKLNQYRGKHIHAISANEHLNGTWVYGYLAGENYIHVTYRGLCNFNRKYCRQSGIESR